MSEGTEIRRIAEGETISVGVVHDFLLAVLRSEAICDVLLGAWPSSTTAVSSIPKDSLSCCPN